MYAVDHCDFCMQLIVEICLCSVNVTFMYYIHTSQRKVVVGEAEGLNYINIYIMEKGCGGNNHLAKCVSRKSLGSKGKSTAMAKVPIAYYQ